MIYDSRREAIDRQLKSLQELQPFDVLRGFVDYVKEETNPMDGEPAEEPTKHEPEKKLDGTLMLCPDCGRNFLVPRGKLIGWPWKFQKTKNHKITKYYFCTYSHMMAYERKMRREPKE